MLHGHAGNFRHTNSPVLFGNRDKVPVWRQADISILAFAGRYFGNQFFRFEIPDAGSAFL